MSTVHDTTNLKPYKVGSFPSIDENPTRYITSELQNIAASLNQCVVALKALEVRIVAGGL